MTNFKIGQQVVCTLKGYLWKNERTGEPDPGPKYNEVVTIVKMYEKGKLLAFQEFGEKNAFYSEFFRPIDYSRSAISELVNVKIISETSDLPMKNPSPMKPLKQLINN